MRAFTMTPWLSYCSAIAKGASPAAWKAKLCVTLGHHSAGASRGAVQRRLASRKIDGETYASYMDAIDTLQEMRQRGVQTHAIATPDSDWHSLGGAGHMRRIHLGSNS